MTSAAALRFTTTMAASALVSLAACSSRLPLRPEIYTKTREEIVRDDRAIDLDLVKPTARTHPEALIFFATDDAGWIGASKDIFRHLAEQGYPIAAYDSREMLKRVKRSGALLTFAQAADVVEFVLREAKQKMAIPETTPVIVAGDSRGAGMVVFTAGDPELQKGITGAIALTRESDYLKVPDPSERPSSIHVDDRGRIQTYPALERLGSIKIAVIQSTGDSYVPAAEARTLFGPDTPTRRLYAVKARNHGFDGGREELLRDLDAALSWIDGASGR